MESNAKKIVLYLHMDVPNRTEASRWYLKNQAWRKFC
jgi:hypothetical protein